MFLKPCAAETASKDDSSNLEESMEAASSVACSAKATIEGDSSKIEEAAEPMELSPVVVKSCPTKRKAEFEPEDEEDEEDEEEEEEEESRSEMEERIAKAKIEQVEAAKAMLEPPEWDVDSFEGVEYSSPDDSALSSDEESRADMERRHELSRIVKRQLIESKGFYAELGLKPRNWYRRIYPVKLDQGRANGRTFRDTCEEVVSVCLEKHNQDKDSNVECVDVVRGNYRGGPRPKFYITFMAKEKPDGPLVEYQAKAMRTLDMKIHPILCRPAPPHKPLVTETI